MPAEELESKYRNACEDPSFQHEEEVAEDEAEELSVPQDGGNECMNLLSTLKSEAAMSKEADETKEAPPSDAGIEEPQFNNFPDLTEMKELFATDQDSAAAETRKADGSLPVTLSDALALPGDLFNNLFRLCVRLRTAPGGCDTRFLPNALNARRASPKMNWHQRLDPVDQFSLCIPGFSLCLRSFSDHFVGEKVWLTKCRLLYDGWT